MRVVAPISRKKLGRDGLVLVVARELDQPFAPGETIADTDGRYTIVTIEACEGPREVQLLVKRTT